MTATMHFQGRQRQAALHILDATPLGDTLARLDAIADTGERLAIEDRDDWHFDGNLSSGERELMQFLGSLNGQGLVSVHWLLNRIDADCQRAVIAAIGAACGIGVAA